MNKDDLRIEKTEDGLDTLFSGKYKQTYHSRHGVLQEAQHVFLSGTGVDNLLYKNKKCSILEIGFGTGFNFFLTAGLAKKHKAQLEYLSVEKNPLPLEVLETLNHDSIENAIFIRRQFLEWQDQLKGYPSNGTYEFNFSNGKLILIVGNALNVNLKKDIFDAVYLDAFSPEQNPELWTTDFFKKLNISMRHDALMSTYSAKGAVRRAMLNAGFEVYKKPGPKGKREMLVAQKP